ncbi:hypothetical protein ABW19_dt0209216 [Dactylella cylindrospora]|nr:hypothetical protein ABW19_dt0209216 [Dactylella cylindrospora]
MLSLGIPYAAAGYPVSSVLVIVDHNILRGGFFFFFFFFIFYPELSRLSSILSTCTRIAKAIGALVIYLMASSDRVFRSNVGEVCIRKNFSWYQPLFFFLLPESII